MTSRGLKIIQNLCRTVGNAQSNGFRSSNYHSIIVARDFNCGGNPFWNRQNALLWSNTFSRGLHWSNASHMNNNSIGLPWTRNDIHVVMTFELPNFRYTRLFSVQAKAPAQARQMGALKVTMLSPGFVYEPYAPREAIPFWKRWFTRSGWKRTKEDIILELKSAYAIAKLRKAGYSKQKFYVEAVDLYKEINTNMAKGDLKKLRKSVTEKMYSALKSEIKQRETAWSDVYWELVEPIVKIRTLRARLIGVDRNDLSKVFVQLTLEFLTKQKFEAYDHGRCIVAGDKNEEVLVRDIWVFEKSLFHPGATWRLCGRMQI